MNIIEKIKRSIEYAADFLEQSVAENGTPLIKRCSSFHDVGKYPDMCLPATYNGTHALILSGRYKGLTETDRQRLIGYINDFQTESGAFRFHNMKDDEIWKGKSLEYTWDYIDNHITNYCMGALSSLKGTMKYPLRFADKYQDTNALSQWLMERNLADPWLEGNNIVNLASFLICELEGNDDDLLMSLMNLMIQWHDEQQDPETGFWGTNLPENPAGIMEAMAGAAHNFHLYFYYDRKIPHHEKIVDYCLEFVRGPVRSACLDVDVVDILVNMIPYGYRADEIKEELSLFAQKLIDFQNADGGFADEKKNAMVRRMDGWVKGYFEPQGYSNCFATWFRCITLAMIAFAIDQDAADRYQFRDTIGIGYFNKKYLR